MELTLNIYDGKKVVKTYKSADFVLTTGTCEDILQMVDIDRLTSGKLTEQELGIEIVKLVAKSFAKFRPLFQEVFDGLSEEEYKHTSVKEVANNIFNIVQFTISELFNVGGNSKN